MTKRLLCFELYRFSSESCEIWYQRGFTKYCRTM